MKINPVRGTHDLFGEEINKFNKVVAEVKNISQQFGFNELITPIFESSELFKKPLGEQSDVVLKEMYTFNDRNEDEITLRPEYTTPMIRALIIGVVYSGLNVISSSFRSLKVYISFKTTSLCSPKGFLNNSELSNIGVISSLNPNCCEIFLTSATTLLNLFISSPNKSWVPLTGFIFILLL